MMHKSLTWPFAAILMAASTVVAGSSLVAGEPAHESALLEQWTSVDGHMGQHFSPLQDINRTSVSRLGLQWSLDLPGENALEGTPLFVDGVLYFSGQASRVYAVDAVSGKKLWDYDPETWKYLNPAKRTYFLVNRGVAYWQNKVYVATFDGRLIALDAQTGKPLWNVRTLPLETRMTISGAPRVFNGKVVIGNAGGDFGERGYATAYDANTGKQLWRFYAAPGNPALGYEDDAVAMAAKTWRGEWWKTGTGGTPWDSFTYDPELNRLYIGMGNSGPYNPEVRSPGGGDNLFLSSIVAVDADTGKYIWHYQQNPREAWDYKATANMALGSMEISGKTHKVLMQIPTNGFFYVIDRQTGKLLSAEKVGKVTWADRIDLATGRPVEIPNVRYQEGAMRIWPGSFGGHNWQPMAFNPALGLAYIPYLQLGTEFGLDAAGRTSEEMKMWDATEGKGHLIAWDPVTQKERWRVNYRTYWNGGVLATGGNLVFQGDEDGMFNAYDGENGVLLWRFNAQLGIISAPITYKVNGIQYVSVLVGHGGAVSVGANLDRSGWKYGAQPRRLLTFALDGKASLPNDPPRNFQSKVVYDPGQEIDDVSAQKGAILYYKMRCALCHGIAAIANGTAPDLRESELAANEQAFREVLVSGALRPVGMPPFNDLHEDEIHALYSYFRQQARNAAVPGKSGEAEVLTNFAH